MRLLQMREYASLAGLDLRQGKVLFVGLRKMLESIISPNFD